MRTTVSTIERSSSGQWQTRRSYCDPGAAARAGNHQLVALEMTRMPIADEIPERLHSHLVSWLGAWPPAPRGVTVVAYEPRTRPGWDGHFHSVVGVATEEAALLSVPPAVADAVAGLVRQQDLETDLGALRSGIARAMESQGRLGRGRFRWSDSPTQTPDVGDWTPTDDDRVPEWLKPFNGDVLIAWDDNGQYGARQKLFPG